MNIVAKEALLVVKHIKAIKAIKAIVARAAVMEVDPTEVAGTEGLAVASRAERDIGLPRRPPPPEFLFVRLDVPMRQR
jgi:hypothetical protein